MSKFITIDEYGEIVYQSRATTYRQIKNGLIPTVTIGKKILIPYSFLDNLESRAMEGFGITDLSKKK